MLRIREIRKSKKLTLDQLSNKSGVSKRMISAYEAGTNDITLSKMRNIASALNVSLWEIVNDNITFATSPSTLDKGIPLIPVNAMAGIASGEISVLELDCDRFVIPTFKGADYLISIKGSSMQPKYYSGDIVACKKVPIKDVFFQWNKVYVLDTNQGALVKRIKQIQKSDTHILCVSDNDNYEPFELPMHQIHAIAIVMGVIRLE